MRRVCVVGSSGAGKTHLARRLAGRLDVPHVELDPRSRGWCSGGISGTGARERGSAVLPRDPRRNIVLWSWTRHALYRTRCKQALSHEPSAWVPLRRPADTERWLDGVGRALVTSG